MLLLTRIGSYAPFNTYFAPDLTSNSSQADPILAYSAEDEVNTLQWSLAQPDWISIAFDSKMQILRV